MDMNRPDQCNLDVTVFTLSVFWRKASICLGNAFTARQSLPRLRAKNGSGSDHMLARPMRCNLHVLWCSHSPEIDDPPKTLFRTFVVKLLDVAWKWQVALDGVQLVLLPAVW